MKPFEVVDETIKNILTGDEYNSFFMEEICDLLNYQYSEIRKVKLEKEKLVSYNIACEEVILNIEETLKRRIKDCQEDESKVNVLKEFQKEIFQ